jgi:hypothetical protein
MKPFSYCKGVIKRKTRPRRKLADMPFRLLATFCQPE